MSSKLVWIVGEPGVGKTTLAREILTCVAPPYVKEEIINPKFTLFKDNGEIGDGEIVLAAAGFWRGNTFDGADTLPISQIKPAVQYWKDNLANVPITIFDGDKLANAGAIAKAQETSAELYCFILRGEELARHRRASRVKKQNETWAKGRQTKSANFWASFPGNKYELSADDTIKNSLAEFYLKLL